MSTERYGEYYWCVKVTDDVSLDGEIYVMADYVDINSVGALQFFRVKDDGSRSLVNLSIAPSKWLAYYAASVIDGEPVAVERWEGEIYNSSVASSRQNKKTRSRERSKITKSIRYDVLKRDGFKCKLCGASGIGSELEIDHINPIAKGGKTEINNLQVLCKDCNRGKRDKI